MLIICNGLSITLEDIVNSNLAVLIRVLVFAHGDVQAVGLYKEWG